MKKEKSCCFIQGELANFIEEKEIKERIFEKIKEQINPLIEKDNICEFYSGMEEGADLFYADYIVEKKKNYPVKLFCVIPFEEQAVNYCEIQRDLYFYIAENCDKEIMINRQRTVGCKEKRDKFMIEKSDVIILLHDMTKPIQNINLQKIDKEKQIVIIDPFNSKQNASFKRIV